MSSQLSRMFFSGLVVFALAFGAITPALAFDGREGKDVVIGADEVVNDDVYATAETITVDGVIKGDLVAAGGMITINGTVEGDVIAAGQAIVINGKIGDDLRGGAAALQVNESAEIADDLVFGGGSLEVKPGAKIGGDLASGSGQVLMAGDVKGSIKSGTGAFELRGTVSGDVYVALGDVSDENESFSMFLGPDMPISIPSVRFGMKVTESAKVGGEFEYVYGKEVELPAVIAGKVTRTEPPVDPERIREAVELTPVEQVVERSLGAVRNMITIILAGLLLGWLFPAFVPGATTRMKDKPIHALLWGFFTWPVFIFSMLAIVVIALVLAALLGAMTLGGLVAVVIALSISALVTLVLGFMITIFFLSPIMVSMLGGKLLLGLVNPTLGEHKVWPLVVGAVIFAVVAALPFLGGIFWFLAALFGLGALWMMLLDLFKKPAAA